MGHYVMDKCHPRNEKWLGNRRAQAHQESEEGPTYMSMVEINANVVGYIDCF